MNHRKKIKKKAMKIIGENKKQSTNKQLFMIAYCDLFNRNRIIRLAGQLSSGKSFKFAYEDSKFKYQ